MMRGITTLMHGHNSCGEKHIFKTQLNTIMDLTKRIDQQLDEDRKSRKDIDENLHDTLKTLTLLVRREVRVLRKRLDN